MDKKYIFLFSILVYLMISCEYDTKEIYEIDIDNNANPPDIEVVYLDLSGENDTIELLYNRVYFHFESSEQDIQRVNFYVNDSLIGNVESNNSYYDINYYFIYSGYHRLRLEIVTHSGTGSIADSLGLEGFLFSTKEWIIKVLESEYSYVTSTVENGFLKLRWTKPYVDVREYVIYHSEYQIGKTTDNTFIDQGYVGEGGTYHVKYIDNNSGELQSYGWVDIPCEIKIEFIADYNNNYYIEWNEPKYYAAIDSAVLFSTTGLNVSSETFANVNSLKYPIPIELFGTLKDYWLMFTPKYYNPYYEVYIDPNYGYTFPHSNKLGCMIGYLSPISDYIEGINGSEIIYHTNKYDHGSTAYNDSIFRYSIVENKILSRYRYFPPDYGWSGDIYKSLSTSPDGQHFAATIGQTGTLMYCSTYDFSDYMIIENEEFINSSQIKRTAISNTGIGIVFTNSKVYLYDFENDIKLDELELTLTVDDYNISSDGQYISLKGTHRIWLYSTDNETLTLEEEINNSYPYEYDYFNFHETEPDKIVSWNDETGVFYIRSCPGLDIINSFSLTEEEIIDIDYSTNKILSFSPNLLVVRSLENGEILNEIPNSFSFLYPNDSFKLIGNSIFYNKGARYFLD